MKFIELPIIPHPNKPDVQMMFVSPENVFFIAEGKIPTALVAPGPEKKPIFKDGTLLGSAGGGGLLVDMLITDVIALFNLAGHTCFTGVREAGQKEDGNGDRKPVKKNKRRVRKGLSNVKGRPDDN